MNPLKTKLRGSVGASVWDSVRASVGVSVWDSVWWSVRRSVQNSARRLLLEHLREKE